MTVHDSETPAMPLLPAPFSALPLPYIPYDGVDRSLT